MPDDPTQPPPLTERQWNALGQLHRLQEQHQPAGRGTPDLHLATLKPLAAVGLVDPDEMQVPRFGAHRTDGMRTECASPRIYARWLRPVARKRQIGVPHFSKPDLAPRRPEVDPRAAVCEGTLL